MLINVVNVWVGRKMRCQPYFYRCGLYHCIHRHLSTDNRILFVIIFISTPFNQFIVLFTNQSNWLPLWSKLWRVGITFRVIMKEFVPSLLLSSITTIWCSLCYAIEQNYHWSNKTTSMMIPVRGWHPIAHQSSQSHYYLHQCLCKQKTLFS